MAQDEVLSLFTTNPDYSGLTAHIETIPERAAVYGSLPDPLPEPLARYLSDRRISLYTHQCEAIRSFREGKDIILTTGTASGKTLAFSLPVFERLYRDPDARALFLYPTKALSHDQLKTFIDMEHATGIRANPGVYDGDTPADIRPRIRAASRLVISNPYELHAILSWHHQWSGFFKHLSAIVIDEAHQYRGVFGSNVAFVIRRLRRMCKWYGSDPRIILSSATLANPAEFAGRLTGKPCRGIASDGSPAGQKSVILYNPFSDGDMTRATYRESAKILYECIARNLQVLCFTGSRKLTELITLQVRDDLIRRTRHDPTLVSSYRAGYLPEERREIEDSMKSGRLKGIVSTNALEVGIDVGSLDGVIMTGFPGTMISTWQQAGRAGRRNARSFAILVGHSDPLDQYFMHHPDVFFGTGHEHAIIDLNNPYILSGQVLCAAAELPVSPGSDVSFFGDTLPAIISSLEEVRLLSPSRRGYIYSGSRRPVDMAGLSDISPASYKVICDGMTLETLDQSQAFREAHEGAILYHRGEKYHVLSMDTGRHTIRVKPTDVDYYTKPIVSVDVKIVSEEKRRSVGGSTLCFGEVLVTEQCTSYRVMRYDAILSIEPLSLPPVVFKTRALWFIPGEDLVMQVAQDGHDLGGGLHGAEHALIAVMPLHVMCDRWDIGGFSSESFPGTHEPTVVIYDGFEGGIGLSEQGYHLFEEIAGMTRDLVKDCPCDSGCPSCIYSPKCGNDNMPLDKCATVTILNGLVETGASHHSQAIRHDTPAIQNIP